MLTVIEKLVGCEVSQLVVVDEEEKPVGVISSSDLLRYLVSVHRQTSTEAAVRRGSVASRLRQRREDSIGEEVELEEDQESSSSPENINFNSSCSPPRWFNVTSSRDLHLNSSGTSKEYSL